MSKQEREDEMNTQLWQTKITPNIIMKFTNNNGGRMHALLKLSHIQTAD